MKKMNKKLTTLMLAGALCVATLGGVAAANPIVSMADDEKVAKTYPYAQDIESERDLMKIAESK